MKKIKQRGGQSRMLTVYIGPNRTKQEFETYFSDADALEEFRNLVSAGMITSKFAQDLYHKNALTPLQMAWVHKMLMDIIHLHVPRVTRELEAEITRLNAVSQSQAQVQERTLSVDVKGKPVQFVTPFTDEQAINIVATLVDTKKLPKSTMEFASSLLKPKKSAKQMAWVHKIAVENFRKVINL